MTFLVCGLGNPGSEYEKTYHNAGFMVIDALSTRWNIALRSGSSSAKGASKGSVSANFNAIIGDGRIASDKAYLMKPLSFMNLSGAPLARVMSYYKLELDNLIVAHDDIDLPFGTIKLKRGGGEGGHNGLKSISGALKSKDYLRIRVGVGRPDNTIGTKTAGNHVLKKVTGNQAKELPFLIDQAADAVEYLMENGLEKAQMRFHAG